MPVAIKRLGKNTARWVDFGLWVTTVMLLLTVGISALGTERLFSSRAETFKSHQLILGLEQMLSLAQDMETGQRGFIITGNQEYLQPYLNALPRIDPQLDALSGLFDGDAAQTQRLASLRSILKKKEMELASTIELRRVKGFDAAEAIIANDSGKAFMEEAREIVHEMQGTAQNQLEAVRERAKAMRDLVIGLELVSGILTLGVCVSFGYMMRRLLRAEAQTAEQLFEQRELLHVTLSGIGDGVIAINVAGDVTFLNQVAEGMTGWKNDAAVGHPIDDVVTFKQASTQEPVANPALIALNERRVVSLPSQTSLFGKTAAMTIEGNGAPTIDASGQLVGAVLVIRDISERERSEERFRLAVEAAPSAMILTDRDGRIMLVNAQAEDVFGYPRDELIGQAIEVLVPDRFRASHPAYRELFYGTMSRRSMGMGRDLYGLRRDGTEFPVEIGLNPIETSDGIYVLSAIVDITERKRGEEELRRRSEALARSNEDLEQFAYVASHDLQEPLRAVAGPLQLLQRRYAGQLDARADEFINHAVDGATRMQALIDDLLRYSRVGRLEDQAQSADCELALDEALKNLKVAIDEAGAQVTSDTLPVIRAIQAQLVLLFQNLVGNAIKFRSRDRAARIHVGARALDEAWQFTVIDNGIGIEPRYFGRIFHIFQRLHTRLEYPGTGIGLAMSKRIVERYGGSIWVESAPGEGTTFFFTLPK